MIGRGKTTADSLHLRKSPDGEIIEELAKWTLFDVVDVKVMATAEWLLVHVDRTGSVGYVAAKFVEWQRNIPTRPQSRPVNPYIPPDVMPSRPARPLPPLFPEWMPFALAAGVVFAIIAVFWLVVK